MKNLFNIIFSSAAIKAIMNRIKNFILKKIITVINNYLIKTLKPNSLNKLYNSLKIFIHNFRFPDPELIWNLHIKRFFITNKVGILGTIALHMVVIIIFLFVRINALDKIRETGLIIEFETEIVEIPLGPEEDRFKNNENRRNIAVNQDDPEKDEIEDYSQNYNFNEEEIERIVSDNIQKIYEETHGKTIPDNNDPDNLVILQADDPVINLIDDSLKTYKGPTNIYYSLENRRVLHLAVPVYKCEGSGKVKVEIRVNQRGYVNSVKVVSGDASDNQCLAIAARNAALITRFNPNVFAPFRQTGNITYNFIAQ